jgi:AraC family transcriptional regulator of adaptative response / DNA-3-methyladenine glycosylase II
MEVRSQLAQSTAWHISQDFLAGRSLADLARKVGVTDRQMRRVFREEFGVAPVEFWQTQRLLLAKQLLTDSRMPVTEVALASGFQSVRRFNALLKERYRLSPTELRKRQGPDTGEAVFRLGYRAPFDWDGLLRFLSRRIIPGVEEVRDGTYSRTLRVKRQDRLYAGHLEVRNLPEHRTLSVRLSDGLLPVCAGILERIRRLFDLHADPVAIAEALGPLAEERPGLRVPGSFDGFEMAVRAVLGQQISVAAARTLAGRLAERFGAPLEGAAAGLNRLFPAAQKLARATAEELARLGIIRQRGLTLVSLARAVSDGQVALEPGHRVEETLGELRRIPGIGEWTAQYIAMRALSWPDAFPHTDLGIRKALGERSPKRVLELTEQWRPWRAYAALHLWATLEKKDNDLLLHS